MSRTRPGQIFHKVSASGGQYVDDRINKREAEQFYSKATKGFDKWFFSLPRHRQEEMRASGVIPYREMKANEFVFPINTESSSAVITPIHDPNDTAGNETFYSRERVEEFTRRLLDTLAQSSDPSVRLHFELVKLVLKDSRALTNEALAKLFGMTRAGINFRVQHIRSVLAGKKPKNTANAFSDASKQVRCEKTGVKRHLRGGKESPKGGTRHRVAAHPGSFSRMSKRRGKGACE